MSDNAVEIVEVAARDGLQSEPDVLDTATKVELINRCVEAGARRIEVASFVNPKRVPQMADAEAVLDALPDRPGVSYIGLVLNRRGFERAMAAAVDEINVVVPVTDAFCQQNQGTTVDGMLTAWGEVAASAHQASIPVSVVLSVAFGCPYEGEVPVGKLVDVAKRVGEHGPAEVSLADTIGVASPVDVRERLDAVRAAVDAPLHVHFHNTRNTGLANVAAAVEWGVTALDASLGGIGGCPFAPKATGNVPTEDVAYMLERMGFDTGLDLEALTSAVDWLESTLGRRVPGLLAKAGVFPASAGRPADG